MIVAILISLRHTAIEELYLAGTCIGVNDTIDQVLGNLQYLHIRVLSLDRNQIHEMQYVFKRLPHIENFTVTHNQLSDWYAIFRDIRVLVANLTRLDIIYQILILESSCSAEAGRTKLKGNRDKVRDFPGYPRYCDHGTACAIWWPEKLEWIAFSHVSFAHVLQRLPFGS